MSAIRDVIETDIPVFFEHQRDPEAMDMAKMPARDEEAFTAHWQKILADDASTQKTILFDGEVAGNLLVFDQGGKRLVGYWIGREFWGQGPRHESAGRAAHRGDGTSSLRLRATSNVGSIRVLEKCGFTFVSRKTEFDERLGEEIEEALYVLEA